ncbi:MAG: hypothetical protein DHS20C05_20700 [Hyphococcus sp.]|nr:MAG: hypothetical protein DHS20C05_20700 [Marinicaulis sp.]
MGSYLDDILAFPLLLAELAIGAIGFSTAAFLRAAQSAEAQTAAVTIAFLAGVSEMLGQSIILVVNRVALYRFLASLAFTGLTYVVTALIWGLSALAVAPLTRVGALSLADFSSVVGVLALAFAPRLLGVFSLAPYFGGPLANILEAWAMALAIFGLHVALELPLGAAVFCGLAGWAVSYGLRSFFGRLLAKQLSHLRIMVSGTALEATPQQIIDDLMDNLLRETKK